MTLCTAFFAEEDRRGFLDPTDTQQARYLLDLSGSRRLDIGRGRGWFRPEQEVGGDVPGRVRCQRQPRHSAVRVARGRIAEESAQFPSRETIVQTGQGHPLVVWLSAAIGVRKKVAGCAARTDKEP